MHLTVVGSGYVGLVAAACFADMGHEVVCVDNDERKVESLRRGEIPIHEQYLPELLSRHRGARISFSSSLAKAVDACSALFITVGTPSAEHGEADMSYVEAVARELATHVSEYRLVVEKSTVPVLTSEWIRKVMRLNGAREDAFDVASNPEFLREGSAVADFLYPDRIVLGGDSPRSLDILRQIYEPLISGSYYRQPGIVPVPPGMRLPPPLIATSTKSAELIKHSCNAFLAMKISFINAVATMCEAVGADVKQVCQGIGSDSRIGTRFLEPGIGYGGSCFPKDLLAFQAVAREYGYDFRLLDEVRRINEEQRERFLRKARNALWTLRGKRLAVLGLAFKGGTDDVRESPAIAVIRMLLKEGCVVSAFDPAATERAREILPADAVAYARSPYEAAQGADALLILTNWPEFSSLDLDRVREVMNYPIVLDGRNLYDPAEMARHGFIYYSIGRPDALPAELIGRTAAKR